MKDINKKSKQVNILLSQKEYIKLLDKCNEQHLKVSSYVRHLVLTKLEGK